MTNVCNAVNHLEKMGIVGVMRGNDDDCRGITNPIKGVYLIDEWMYALLMGYED